MKQKPITKCQYCGSEDIGEGWQHGEGLGKAELDGAEGQTEDVPEIAQHGVQGRHGGGKGQVADGKFAHKKTSNFDL